jgi:hypothetical protein
MCAQTPTEESPGDGFVFLVVTDPHEKGYKKRWVFAKNLLSKASRCFERMIRENDAVKIELSHHPHNAANIVLSIISQTWEEITPPDLGLMVDIARFCKEFDIPDSLVASLPYWLHRHFVSDRWEVKIFNSLHIGHYLWLTRWLDDGALGHDAEMLARERLTLGFDRKWRKDEDLRGDKALIGTCRKIFPRGQGTFQKCSGSSH